MSIFSGLRKRGTEKRNWKQTQRHLLLESLEDRHLLSVNMTPAILTPIDTGAPVINMTGTEKMVEEAILITTTPISETTLSELPDSVKSVDSGTTVYVSIWVKNIDESEDGISAVYCDLYYDSDRLIPAAYQASGIFSVKSDLVSCSEGVVSLFGGAAEMGKFYGVDSWGLIGTYSFTANYQTSDSSTTACFWNWTPTINGKEMPAAGIARGGKIVSTDAIQFSNVWLTINGKGEEPITNVSLEGWNGYYDGKAHTVALNDPESETDTITYIYGGEKYDQAPVFTEVGIYSVSVQVERDGYKTWTDTADVVINALKPITDVSLEGWNGVYDGQAHTIKLTDPSAETDTVSYLYNGQTYDELPTFTAVGVYTIGVVVERAGYETWTGAEKVEISTLGPIPNISLEGWDGCYDGESHSVTLTGTMPTDKVVYYYNGVTYETLPTFTEVGTYTLGVSIRREGYDPWSGGADVVIRDPLRPDMTVTGMTMVSKYDATRDLSGYAAETTDSLQLVFTIANGGDADAVGWFYDSITVRDETGNIIVGNSKTPDGSYESLFLGSFEEEGVTLKAGESGTHIITAGMMAAGTYTVEFTVNCRGICNETNLTNNKFVQAFVVKEPETKPSEIHLVSFNTFQADSAYPDGGLILKGTIVFSNLGPYSTDCPGNRFYSRLTLYNKTAGEFVFSCDGYEFCHFGTIESGEETSYVVTLGALPDGEYELAVILDSRFELVQTTHKYGEGTFNFTVSGKS